MHPVLPLKGHKALIGVYYFLYNLHWSLKESAHLCALVNNLIFYN